MLLNHTTEHVRRDDDDFNLRARMVDISQNRNNTDTRKNRKVK